ncbi:MAG: serine hydrolase [Cytophagales bacterium]|nr:serine hydrolase [Cytophagales bacterium]
MKETGIPSISYSIFNSDSVISSNAIGFSNVKLKIPATKETIYNTGSTFKVITAMSVMQLYGKQQLNIDTPIANYLQGSQYNDFDKNNPVTLRHLLSHRSGLVGETIKIPIWERNVPKPLDSLIATIKPHQKPGIEFRYCNPCYGISGYLVQKITGRSFGKYVIDELLRPLSITYIDPFKPTPRMMEQMALPYTKENNKPVSTNFYRYNSYPAGDAYLTPSDMAKLLVVQLNKGNYNGISILDPDNIKEMQKNQFTPNNYGLGVGVSNNGDSKIVMHGGTVPGFSAYFILDTKIKKGIYIMANCGDSGDVLLSLSEYVIRLLRGENVTNGLPSFAKIKYTEILLDTHILKDYEGKYKIAPEMGIDIFLEGEKLFAQLTGQSKIQIFPYERNKFFIKVTDAQIEFNNDGEGNITSLTLFQKGKSIDGQRIK